MKYGAGSAFCFEASKVALQLLIHGVEEDAVAGAEYGGRAGKERRQGKDFHKFGRWHWVITRGPVRQL